MSRVGRGNIRLKGESLFSGSVLTTFVPDCAGLSRQIPYKPDPRILYLILLGSKCLLLGCKFSLPPYSRLEQRNKTEGQLVLIPVVDVAFADSWSCSVCFVVPSIWK